MINTVPIARSLLIKACKRLSSCPLFFNLIEENEPSRWNTVPLFTIRSAKLCEICKLDVSSVAALLAKRTRKGLSPLKGID